MSNQLEYSDPEVFKIILQEEARQQEKLSMIPSENFFSPAVHEAVGSVFSHKYSEGNIGRRYYEGNVFVDELEALTIKRAGQAFRLPDDWTANVQALSGSSANLAVYLALLKFGDTIMALYLPDGGHLSHGWSFEPDVAKRTQDLASGSLAYLGGSRKVNITSLMFNVVQYKTDPKTRLIDYEALARLAKEYRPKLIITGGTAYPRDINYGRVRQIADSVKAYYLADIAHEAGLIAGGILPSPVGVADVVTLTTHKTLRSGRGAIVMAHRDIVKKVNRAVLPGLQGGPHNHNIAGICVGLGEALRPEFSDYVRQTVRNAKHLAAALSASGFTVVSGGTDKHLVLLDLTDQRLLGRSFARALDYAGIVANANSIPQETRGPADPSGLRLGTPWLTTRGMKEEQMEQIAQYIYSVMQIAAPWADFSFDEFTALAQQSAALAAVADEVRQLCERFPLPVHDGRVVHSTVLV